jgi:hypothetical protein
VTRFPRIELVRNPGEDDNAVAAAAELRLLLKGRIPAGARTFTWSNAVRLGTYMLTLESEGSEIVERQWLENDKESKPFVLAASIGLWSASSSDSRAGWTTLACHSEERSDEGCHPEERSDEGSLPFKARDPSLRSG